MGETQKISDKDHRPQLSPAQVGDAVKLTSSELIRCLDEKGYGAWLSRHEIFGVVDEEYIELGEAVHSETKERVKQELLDLAVACIFGVACIDAETLDW
ncbi:hypothetical protein KAR91_62575 [Candidatus Pacearchaeota archaeon]|nr:hypothetical protein [Candidatus Pacearchaeota archaeon]